MKRTLCFALGLMLLTATEALAQDVCAPAKVTTLATQTYYASIKITWTATGDDCSTGNASTYEVRYSNSTITDINWQSASVLATGSSVTNGNVDCAIFTGSCPGPVTKYFAVFLFDAAGNRSPISNVVAGSTRCSSPFTVPDCP